MNILVIGCGSIGKRHIRNLVSLKAGEVSAFDVAAEKADGLGVKVFTDMEAALSQDGLEAVFICTPPSLHVAQALKALETGLHCFIEKPLSNGTEGIDELIRASEERRKVVMVGYNTRFSPNFIRLKTMIDAGAIGKVLSLRASIGYFLPYWRPHEDYRKGYGARRELGGGIILDASHEIDYVRHLLGEVDEVFAVVKKISDLDINTEDFAEVTMRHKDGAYSQIHFDYLQSNYRRSCEVIGSKGMLLWDLNERSLRHYGLNDKEYRVFYEGLGANVNDSYVEEVKCFFRCIDGAEKLPVDLRDALRVQGIISKINESSDAGRILKV